MITKSNKIKILWRLNTSYFIKANQKVLSEEPRRLGSAESAVKKMLGNAEEQKAIMPSVIGADPQSLDWTKRLENYWNSLAVDIPSGGKDLEIGFNYEFNTNNQIIKSNIESLSATVKTIKDDKTLAEYVEDKLDESEKYKYGTPINPQDYSLYRYCLVYGDVANTIEDVEKSPRIRFYLHSETKIKEERKKQHEVTKAATALYLKVIGDEKTMDNVIYAMKIADKLEKDADENDKAILLDSEWKKDPKKFIEIAKDKNLESKGNIEKLISGQILKRLPNSEIIVDNNDPEIVLGNNLDEAISYINNEKNKSKVTEYFTRLKGLKT